jgi:hypothetical protein
MGLLMEANYVLWAVRPESLRSVTVTWALPGLGQHALGQQLAA